MIEDRHRRGAHPVVTSFSAVSDEPLRLSRFLAVGADFS